MPTVTQVVGALPSEPAPFGLLTSAEPVRDSSDRWAGGFSYETTLCSAAVVLTDVCNPTTTVDIWRPGANLRRSFDYVPFVVRVEDSCSTFGFTAADRQERVLARLETCTQKAVEYEFWTGELAQAAGSTDNRFLASSSSSDLTPSGTAVKVKHGLAILEQALADCGCGTAGVIHARRDVASALGASNKDGRLQTGLGNLLIAGVGYTGSGPAGEVASTSSSWIYATGPVSVRLGDPVLITDRLNQTINTTNNDLIAVAERAAAVTWDGCCSFAVNVNLTLEYS